MLARCGWVGLVLLVAGGVHGGVLGTDELDEGPVPAAAPGAVDALPAAWPDQLTIYAVKAPSDLDWSGPSQLVRSILGNQLTPTRTPMKRDLGHMFVRLRRGGARREDLVGMTTADPDEARSLVLDQAYGLGLFGADMLGRFDDPAALEKEIAAKQAIEGELGYLRVLLSPALGARLGRYLDEYVAQGLDRHYGGGNRPRYREGGGCAPFALSFLELAGLMEPEYAAWRVERRVPAELFGGPFLGVRAPLGSVLLRGDWARAGEDAVTSVSWDPTRVMRWIGERHRAELARPSGRWRAELAGYALGLGIDARDRAAPAEPIWLADPPGAVHPLGRQPGLRRGEVQ